MCMLVRSSSILKTKWISTACLIMVAVLLGTNGAKLFGDDDNNFLLYCAALIISILPIILSLNYLKEQIENTKKHFDSIERPNIILTDTKTAHTRIHIQNETNALKPESLNVGITIKNVGKTAASIIDIKLHGGYLYEPKHEGNITDALNESYRQKNFGEINELAADDYCYLQWRVSEEEKEEINKGNKYCFRLLVKYMPLTENKEEHTESKPTSYEFVGYINNGIVIKSNRIADKDNTIREELNP